MTAQVRVASQRQPYGVWIASGATRRLPELVGEVSRVAVIYSAELPELAKVAAANFDGPEVSYLPVPDAEAAKTPQVLAECWDRLASLGFTRSDVVVGVGGGTITDLAGFVAASWLRGVPYFSVPTTVLGMVDAAVGGKTGINLNAGKNLVGAFYEPTAVLCDLELLASLPAEEVSSGLAEVIKCGFIADQKIIDLVAAQPGEARDPATSLFAELVERAVRVKAEVVAADFTERTSQGSQVGREALNYGHTLGHAIEARERFRMRHGQAISIGMCWIAEVSRELLGLPQNQVVQHRELLQVLGLPTSYRKEAFPELRRLMSLDKKARGQQLRLVGLREFGRPEIISGPDEEILASCYRNIADAVVI